MLLNCFCVGHKLLNCLHERMIQNQMPGPVCLVSELTCTTSGCSQITSVEPMLLDCSDVEHLTPQFRQDNCLIYNKCGPMLLNCFCVGQNDPPLCHHLPE